LELEMANNGSIHLDPSGSILKPRTQSPKVIQAWSQARDSFARTIIGGILLALLTIAYIAALFLKVDGASSILVMIGSGLGFLLGGRERSQSGE
jgi:hypothetical protein